MALPHVEPAEGLLALFAGGIDLDAEPAAIELALELIQRFQRRRAQLQLQIAPLLTASAKADYIGEIGETEKEAFLGGALAVLFPIDWPEPFGLVMIEAMACGTPVIAFKRGSVPEIIDHGVTGFVVETVEEAVEAAKEAASLDRGQIRKAFERRFTAEVMAMGYEQAYQDVLDLPREVRLPSHGTLAKREEPAEISGPSPLSGAAA